MPKEPVKKNRQRRVTRHAALPVKDHGRWRIRWTDLSGKRCSRYFPPDGYQEALAELERIKGERRAIQDGRQAAPLKAPTLADFIERYWNPNRVREMRSPKDALSIQRKHLLPAFGHSPVDRIKTRNIELFRAKLSGLAPATVVKILTQLGSILRYAESMEYVTRLPKIKRPKVPKQGYAYLESHSDIVAFLRAAKTEKPMVYPLYATAVFTGMRAGELFGLRWSDVDFDRGMILVERSFDKPTKSGEVRHVPIVDPLVPILREWRLQNSNRLVFPTELGTMHEPSPRLIKEVFPRVLRKAGLARIRFHDLRHTFASHFLMAGGDIYSLQKILGHASLAMVMRYAHLAPGHFEKDRKIFQNAFDGLAVSRATVVPLAKAAGKVDKKAD